MLACYNELIQFDELQRKQRNSKYRAQFMKVRRFVEIYLVSEPRMVRCLDSLIINQFINITFIHLKLSRILFIRSKH